MKRGLSVLCFAAGVLFCSSLVAGESCSHRIIIHIRHPQVFEVQESTVSDDSGVTSSLTWQPNAEPKKVTVSTSSDSESEKTAVELLVTEPNQSGQSSLFIPAATDDEATRVIAYTVTDAT